MYNLSVFMHNRLVIIKLVMWQAVVPICATEEKTVFIAKMY